MGPSPLIQIVMQFSSGSSSQVEGAERQEIYLAAFVSHLFYDLFSQGLGGGGEWLPWFAGSTTIPFYNLAN